LASKVLPSRHVTHAEFKKAASGYKECCAAFVSAARVLGGRDLVEEFVVAKVWPLTVGWLTGCFSKIEIQGVKDSLPYPGFGFRPVGVSNESIVEEVERESIVLMVRESVPPADQ